ncbi:hypothetical protein [Erythrobacter mangrovi]|uniref:Uncharacterized protein n=1 Tax=Erythrobacter mangrovi TaxID=2739433 RepID=A0A7D3XA67_9SPHN|nr:hypothetical protein [Erythrobacter mangrovi]QKG71595.1 hypothetical protein HQR01_09610 [Erythrobacter mangrovi]
MSELQIMALIPLIGFLILNIAGFQRFNVGWQKALYMAGAWAGIFAIVILFIDFVR